MKTTQGLAASLWLALAAVLGLSQFAISGTIDAVSGASINVSGGTTTATGATINYTFKESGGTRRCYYDVADHTAVSAFPKFATTTGNSFTITGLNGGTKYFYWIQITKAGEASGNLHSSATAFTTVAMTGILRRIPETADHRSSVDPLGRQIGQQRGFVPVRIDPDGSGIRIEPNAL